MSIYKEYGSHPPLTIYHILCPIVATISSALGFKKRDAILDNIVSIVHRFENGRHIPIINIYHLNKNQKNMYM